MYSGSEASPQDRFLVMAAEMDNAGTQELAQFWKEVPKPKVMEHRYENMYEFVCTRCLHYSCDTGLGGLHIILVVSTDYAVAFWKVLNPR